VHAQIGERLHSLKLPPPGRNVSPILYVE
jgi:hypothetical protein